MADSALLKIIDAEQVQVAGLLSVDTVADYQEEGFRVLAALEQVAVFDLKQTEVVGSAAIALLISWQRKAIQLNKEFSVINAPQHLLDMADISGVLDIVPFRIQSSDKVGS